MENISALIDIKKNTDTLIVAFSGHALQFGMIPVFEFYTFLHKHYPLYNKHFYIDRNLKHYHYGIQGISDSVESTVEYLKDKVKDYKKVIFMGVSSGGYAAILFGSLVNVTSVISFIPQTILRGEGLDPNYKNIKKYINTTTIYNVYGDPNIQNPLDCHHMSHCDNISEFPNVIIHKVPDCTEMSKVKRSGQLLDIITNCINNIK